MELFFNIGRYYAFIKRVFSKPEKSRIYIKQTFFEIDKLGIGSLGIVAIISIFMGAVVTLQTAINLENPLIPAFYIGLTTRDTLILEFSSTIVSLILAGKVGSNIASEIGTMRVTEQIDALEIMGINSASFLTLPKIIACVLINPFLVIISISIGIIGGFFVVSFTGLITIPDYIFGIRYAFNGFYIVYTLIKTVAFAFIIASVSSYHGYYTNGGALEVGRSSTKGVVYSMIAILIANYLLTQLLLV
ncbi:MlaE family ABC transporter permease [Bacteroidota bacterium]